MIKLILYALYVSSMVMISLSAMFDRKALQLLPKDPFSIVINHCDLQSLSRLKTTNKHFNNKTDIKNVIRNDLYHYFPSVEQYLYHYASKCIHMEEGNDKKELQQLLSEIIIAHEKKIDSTIIKIYKSIKKSDWGDISFIKLDELQLHAQNRLMFYCGKLPGRKLSDSNLEDMKTGEYSENHLFWDQINASYLDAYLAGTTLKNIPRLKVLLNRYGQFPTAPEGLLSVLCQLQGYSDLVINYLSLPDRGIDHVEAGTEYIDDYYNAYTFAQHYNNHQLIHDLLIWKDKEQNN